jgi:hypothetical protein
VNARFRFQEIGCPRRGGVEALLIPLFFRPAKQATVTIGPRRKPCILLEVNSCSWLQDRCGDNCPSLMRLPTSVIIQRSPTGCWTTKHLPDSRSHAGLDRATAKEDGNFRCRFPCLPLGTIRSHWSLIPLLAPLLFRVPLARVV